MQIDSNIKRSFLFLLFAGALFGLSFLSTRLNAPKPEFELARNVEVALNKIITDYDSLVANEEVINDILKNKLESRYFDMLQKKPYSFLVYKGEELVFWNENQVIPPDFLVNAVSASEGN